MSRLDGAVPAPAAAPQLDADVVILHWPAERARFDELAGDERPRLLLVAPGAAPPETWDGRTDWIRMPADEVDVWTRVAMLQRRAEPRPDPVIDEFDVLWRGSAWLGLSAIDARLMRLLLETPGRVVSRRRLANAGWPDGLPSERMVDAYVKRLRPRIEPLGLAIRTIRSRGYFLELIPDRMAVAGVAP